MSRRATLPGAAELFRATGADQLTEVDTTVPADPAVRAVPDIAGAGGSSAAAEERGSGVRRTEPRRIGAGERRPSGRERHEEKITVYVSADELFELEQARLVLRGTHGLAVDRGRIVREAVALVLTDLESKGEASILVRRLRQG